MKLHTSHISIEALLELVHVRHAGGTEAAHRAPNVGHIAKQNFNAATSDFKMSYLF